jgi:hypothetical protein
VETLTRELSDHTPLLLDTGNASHRGNNSNFRFELSWLTRDDFHETITKVWQEENRGDTPMKKWQNKIRTVRRFLRGWAKNVVRENTKKKCFLVQLLDVLDIKAETSLLSRHALEFKHCLSTVIQVAEGRGVVLAPTFQSNKISSRRQQY